MRFSTFAKQIALTILTLNLMVVSAVAVAPTRDAVKKWKAEGIWEQKVANWKAFKKAGGCSPEAHSVFNKEKRRQNLALGIQTVDTAHVIVILVDFDDWPHHGQSVAGTPANFDSILFSNRDTDSIFNPTGSMTDYYLENSYGQFYIKGDIFGWYRMPLPYSWYVGSDDGLTNGCILAGHAVDSAAADTNVVFSDYDHDHDGFCDGVIIIHPGRGAEEHTYGIWSHKYNIFPARYYGGVAISAYTMNPEESGFPTGVKLSPIGVFCHEYGHVLGLPDLYDIAYNPGSSGLGEWSLMAYGNQLNYSRTPAHLDAWCKASVGFLDLIELDSNVFQDTIPAIEFNPVAYKLQNSFSNHEYWVVENRRRVSFDLYLPGQGLCIYHVDPLAPINNTNPNRYYVAMEQADGNNDLAFNDSKGDAGDPWPGLTREFHNLSVPNSRTNVGGVVTQIGVWCISDRDSLMTADFDIEYSRPWVELYGGDSLVFVDDDSPGDDGYGILEAGETIQFHCTIINKMRNSYNIHAMLTTDNPAVNFVTNNVAFGADLFGSPCNNASAPIEFTLADTLMPVIDSFFLTITTDSLDTTPGSGEFTNTFSFRIQIGAPQVLIVDDDRGENFETKFEEAFLRLKVPTETWHKQTQGSPTGTDLGKYPVVFWHTGDSAGDVLDSNDIAAMKYFMDNGGNLLLTTLSGTYDLASLDSTILLEYFHADTAGSYSWSFYGGLSGNTFSEGTVFRYSAQYSEPYVPLLKVVDGGEIAFTFANFGGRYQDSVCGVSYEGTHKSILLTFPVECLLDNSPGYDPKDTLLTRALKFLGGSSMYDILTTPQLPRNFELHQNYPNPFNPSTNISYTLRSTGGSGEKPARTNLSVYNILGQRVKTLVDKVQISNTYVVTWDGTDRFGRSVASGVYFYRLEKGDDSETKKMVLLK